MSSFLIILFILLSLISLFKYILKYNKRFLKFSKSQLRFNDWMELSKAERQELDLLEKNEKMLKKKALLKSIRQEYLKIKKR